MDKIDNFFQGTENHRTDPKFKKLHDRIAGKEVDLVFIGEDAFEEIDNNYWIPDTCYTLIKGENDDN